MIDSPAINFFFNFAKNSGTDSFIPATKKTVVALVTISTNTPTWFLLMLTWSYPSKLFIRNSWIIQISDVLIH